MKKQLVIAYILGLLTMLLIGAATDPGIRDISDTLKGMARSLEIIAGTRSK